MLLRAIGLCLLLLSVISTMGCGRGTSSIRGKVTYLDKPVQEGAVIFIAEDNRTYPADIARDGTYHITAVPRGKVKVVVQVLTPRPATKAEPPRNTKDSFGKAEAAKDDAKGQSRLPPLPEPAGSGPVMAIPVKYTNPETSGLSIELTEPEHEYDIPLK